MKIHDLHRHSQPNENSDSHELEISRKSTIVSFEDIVTRDSQFQSISNPLADDLNSTFSSNGTEQVGGHRDNARVVQGRGDVHGRKNDQHDQKVQFHHSPSIFEVIPGLISGSAKKKLSSMSLESSSTILEDLSILSQRDLGSTLLDDPDLQKMLFLLGIVWPPKSWLIRCWFILLRFLTVLYTVFNFFHGIWCIATTSLADMSDFYSGIYTVGLVTLYLTAGLFGLNVFISERLCFLRSLKKIPIYLIPLFKIEMVPIQRFLCLGLALNFTCIAISVTLYFQMSKYWFVVGIAFGDLGLLFLFCGIFWFVMVDVRAAEALVQSLEVVEKELSVRHYEIVRKEIKSREMDSRWINGFTTIVALISFGGVILYTLANQYHRYTNFEQESSLNYSLKSAFVTITCLRTVLMMLYIFYQSATVNERANKFIRRLGTSACENESPLHLPYYASLRPIAFRLARIRFTKGRLALQIGAVISTMILGSLRSMIGNQGNFNRSN